MSSSRSRFWLLLSSKSPEASNEQHLAAARGRLVPVQHQDGGGDAGAVEEVRREADHRLKKVLLQQALADLPLRGTAEQHAVGNNDAETAGSVEHGHHVLHEREVALGLRRHAEPEASVTVVLGHVAAPLVEAERGIGDHAIVEQQLSVVEELGIADGVALLDTGVGQAVEQHVHLADGPGAEVLLLPVKGQVPRIALLALDVVRALDEHAARAGGGVADAHALCRREQLDDELDDHARRVELAALLAGVVGELLDEVLVGAAEEVGLGHAVVAQRDLGEVLDEAREHGVAVLRVAELPLVVVVDAGEHALQGRVLILQGRARLVQRLADVRGGLLDVAPAYAIGREELVLVGVGPRDHVGHAVGNEFLDLLLKAVRSALPEDQPKMSVLCSLPSVDPRSMSATGPRYRSSWLTVFADGWSAGENGGSPAGVARGPRFGARAEDARSSVSGSWRENPRKGVQVRRACADT